ncbi:General transcription factor 3C polypeptide 1 [Trichuris trichiura]|uniref:General transcription factor 3C polypeptide 1 n=1 Tax=Trichuris trichiura TaxID=36087 RepID=A0A077Z091_TRITR|nr:General transcription factor 3C polypeptide 1 [Trichuris trichiura]
MLSTVVPKNHAMTSKDAHMVAICFDEVALEGLEGITLNSLWVRLLTRPGFEVHADGSLKQHLWSAIRPQKHLQFFVLDTARAALTKRKIDEDTFPAAIVKGEPGIYGSCCDFRTRKDVTKTLRLGDKYELYSTVVEDFDDRLVVVASQEWRTKAIIGPAISVQVFLRTCIHMLPVHYAMLERIARSRHHGVKTCGDTSLHKVFNVRAKDVFYLVERYVRMGVLYKRSCEMSVDGIGLRVGAFICLQRFSPKNMRDTPEMKRLLDYIRSRPDKCCSKSDLIEELKLDKWGLERAILRLQHRVKVRTEIQYTRKGNPLKKPRIPRDQMEIVCLNEKCAKRVVDQKKREKSEEIDSSSDEKPNWPQSNYFRALDYKIIQTVNSSGNEGITLKDINRYLRISRKVLARRLTRFEKDGYVKALMFTAGRVRMWKYYDPKAEPPSAELYDQLYKKTSVDFNSLPNFSLTDRSCKRLMAIIDFVNERRVVTNFETGQMIREREKEEGYDYCIDKNATATLLRTLASQKLVKVYQTILLDSRNKAVEFFCSPDVQSNDATLLARMRKAQLKSSPSNTLKAAVAPKQPASSRKVEKVVKKSYAKKRSSQGKFVRMQLLHEFIYYLVRDYAGESHPEIANRHPADKADGQEPIVYVDEISWRRYLPPLPPRNDLPSGWFHVDDLVPMLPLSIACQIVVPSEEVDCFTEYLCDRTKRHYMIGDLPCSSQNHYMSFSFVRQRLINICWKLSYLGLIACSNAESAGGQLKDEYYFVHESAQLMDTSTSAAAYMTISEPISQYPKHIHKFVSLNDVRIYWLHLRAIVLSTWLGRRSAKRPDDFPRPRDSYLKASLPRYNFDQVKLLGEPVGPRIGAAGLNPYMFAHRIPNWVVNTRNACELENLEQMKLFAITHSHVIAYRVARLNKNWQSSSFMALSKYKGTLGARARWRSANPEGALRIDRENYCKEAKIGASRLLAFLGAQLAKGKIAKRKSAFLHSHRRMYQRQGYTNTELRLLVLLKSACEVVSSIFPGWYDLSTLVEMIRRHLPAFLTRHGSSVTSKVTALLSNNRKFGRTVVSTKINQIVENYQGNSTRLSAAAKNQVFAEVFDIACNIYKPNEKEEGLSLNNFELIWPSSQAQTTSEKLTENTVRRWALSNVIVGSLASDNDPLQLRYPEKCPIAKQQHFTISDIAEETDGTVRSAGASSTVVAHPFSPRNQVNICGQFRNLFSHNFCPKFLRDALALGRLITSQPSERHNVLGDSAGFVCSVAALMNRRQASFEIVIPNDLLANEQDTADSPAEDDAGTSADRNRWSFIVGVNNGAQTSEQSSIASSQLSAVSKMTILSVRRKLDEEYQRVGTSQSVTGRVQHLRLNPCKVFAQFRNTEQHPSEGRGSTDPWQIAKRELVKRFASDTPDLRSVEKLYKGDVNVLKRIFTWVDQLGFEGMPTDEIPFSESSEESQAVHFLVENDLLVRVGISKERLVARGRLEPWILPAIGTFNLDAITEQVINALYRNDAEEGEEKEEPPRKKIALQENVVDSEAFVVLPRRWLRLDGSINRPLLRWFCEGIFTRILTLPGVLETDLCNHYCSFLTSCQVKELLKFLTDVGCIERTVTVYRPKKFTLFGCSLGEPVECVSYMPTLDCVTKFATVFEGIPLPEGVNV